MKLKLVNSFEELILSDNFKPLISPYRRRVQTQPRYGQPGGEVVGDKQVDVRTISLAFNITSEDITDPDQTYFEQLNEIIGMFRTDKSPYYLVDLDNNRQTRIECSSINDKPAQEGLFFKVGENSLELMMLDAHWEDLEPTVVESSINDFLSSGDVFLVDNLGDVETYPVITLTPSEPNSEFSIEVDETGSLFRISTADFVPGTQIIVSSIDGTVYLSDGITQVEISAALEDGSGMIKLLPGQSTFKYDSLFGNIGIKVEFRKRYIF